MRFLILGAGYAGLTAAYRIRERDKNAEIMVISRSKIVRENTIFPLLLTDEITIEETEFDAEIALKKRGIKFVEAEVKEILPESNEVKTSKGTFDYDYLFIALGGAYEENFEKINGHEHAFMHHTLEGFLGLKKALNEAENGVRIFVGNTSNSPIEGPSYEVALISEYLLRKRGIKGEVYLATQSPRGVFGAIPIPSVSEKANEYFEKKRGIKVLKGKPVKEVRKGKVVLVDGTEVEADIISILPPISAPEVVKRANLTKGEFIDVEFPTFRSKKYKNIFGLGDGAMGMFPAKTARNAMISAENAVASIYGGNYYVQGILCVIAGGDDSGLLRFDNGKLSFVISRNLLSVKKIYSKLLVDTEFDLKIHASPILSYAVPREAEIGKITS
ncbi:MAG: FAD/NAD(P)-binding oxidoreductase [Sulfolobaceae archaeon]